MTLSDQIENCIKTGSGMTADFPNSSFSFYINPRPLPGPLPPKPDKTPRYKDVKDLLTRDAWRALRDKLEQQYQNYLAALRQIRIERETVNRLRRIQAMIKELEK